MNMSTLQTTTDLTPGFSLQRNAFGRLVYTGADGAEHVGVVPVRAFPIAAPDEGLSIVSPDGHELAWVDRLSALPAGLRALLEEELTSRDFAPAIQRIREVSTFSTPSTWHVDTDHGPTSFVLKSEDDIRRLGGGRLLITGGHGVSFFVPDRMALDKHSKRLLERFL
jgi:hypothetical protein